MKAVVITSFGAPEVLKIEDRPIPQISNNNQVLIRVKAAGVNRPDVFQRKGNYPAPEGVQADIPGLEVAGVVEELGEGVTQWKIGDKVCALVAGAGYAEYVAVDAGHCLPVPENFTFIEAASLPETIFTVWHNVFQRGMLKKDEHFLVHGGSSGIGITAIQLARAMGAKVFATAGSDDKCKACIDLGALYCINYRNHDFEKELKGSGIDVILDMIGGAYFNKNIEIMNPEARMVYINSMAGNTVELNIMKMMQKRITITGSTLRGRDTEFKSALAQDILKNIWPLINSGSFKPIIYAVFPISAAAAAHQLMEEGSHIGKIVLEL
ncbi:NAD(P)H-quinone oxidoreductase [Pedobacter sp. MC2016-14]|uniref:NAD(P)H-quinone oxidoreductase n=1 Tax=Pedobacter sp. MC2016-14 TaxID=2897327 RepID=UPI001E62B3BD|nr:NAD(P)H-quinone oxidoreductase [Pedobacter sp. MC2016-14]MCD0490110.1 NAD(P)H-quinone oxidoreductase [Pedobacter sp. MC2016-14]